MSNAALTWTWRQKLRRGPAKVVLAYLADRANSNFVAWPSAPTIASATDLSQRSVIVGLAVLEAAGAITIQRGGGRYGNRYVLHVGTVLPGSQTSQTGAGMVQTTHHSADGERCNSRTGMVQTTSTMVQNPSTMVQTVHPNLIDPPSESTLNPHFAHREAATRGDDNDVRIEGSGSGRKQGGDSDDDAVDREIEAEQKAVDAAAAASTRKARAARPAAARKASGSGRGGERLPEAWRPDPASIGFAAELGLDPDTELAAFRDHHLAKGSIIADWEAAWRTWSRNSLKFSSARAQRGLPLLSVVTTDPRPPSPDIKIDAETGMPCVCGWFVGLVFGEVLALAGMDESTPGLTWLPVVEWLKAGHEPADIEATIRYCASRSGYVPPRSLAAFDRPIREQWGIGQQRA